LTNSFINRHSYKLSFAFGRDAMRRRKPLETWQILGILFIAIISLIFPSVIKTLQTESGASLVTILILFSVLVAVIVFFFLFYIDRRKKKLLRAIKIADVDRMSGVEFEKYVAQLLRSRGNKVTQIGGANDFGVDIILKKDGEKYAVQIKRSSKPVSRVAISDAVGGRQFYKCDRPAVITNSYFTKSAKELAKSTDCLLVDRNKLSEWIFDFQQKKVET